MARVLWIVLGVLAAVSVGVVVLFTLGTLLACLAWVAVLALGIYSAQPESAGKGAVRSSVVGLLVISGALITYGSVNVMSALGDASGPVDPADPQDLTAVQGKLDEQVEDKAGFRLELTDKELTALVQNGLREAGTPFRRVSLRIVGGNGEPGYLEFNGTFRNGKLAIEGRSTVTLEAGALRLELDEVDLGAIDVPGIARGAVEDLINPFANDALTQTGTQLQSVKVTDGKMIVVGTRSGGQVLTSAALLTNLRRNVVPPQARTPPTERLGPGEINATEAEGDLYYVALGDSLAANVGVAEPRDGYVSRFHKQLGQRDGADYGLQNFGVPGETSASLIRGGQLETALAFIRAHDVAYITVNIGANDILGHLASDDCDDGLSAAACQQRIEDATAAYQANLRRIFQSLRDAAPEATILFLQTYNPFSLGFDSQVTFEEQSNRELSEFNARAADAAASYDILVADGQTPLKGHAGVTTHILDNPPDVHPRPLGYDLLAAALLDALP